MTKTAWKPPKDWEADDNWQTYGGPNEKPAFTGRRTYPDGTVREILAHSEEEFDTLAKANDDAKRLQDSGRLTELRAEAQELRDRAREIEQQAKQYDWA